MHTPAFVVFCLLVLSTNCLGAKLPSSFKKCDKTQSDFKQCLLKSAENALGQLNGPFKEVGLLSIDPLMIPSMSIAPGKGPTQFQQNFSDMKISGFSKGTFSKFDIDVDKKTLVMECTFPQIKMDLQYEMRGKVVVLPFFGKGPGVITIDNMKFAFNYDLEEYEKNGNKHYKIVNGKLAMEPKVIHFRLDNLFNGDEKLGNNVNKVFNENWQPLFGDVQSSYEDAFEQIFTSYINNFLAKVPVSELF